LHDHVADEARLRSQPEGGDEPRVELAHRHRLIEFHDAHLRHAERREDDRQLALCQRVVGPKIGAARRHQSRRDDDLDLRRGPGRQGRLRTRAGTPDGDGQCKRCKRENGKAAPHATTIGSA
jgi:hypothetical protein